MLGIFKRAPARTSVPDLLQALTDLDTRSGELERQQAADDARLGALAVAAAGGDRSAAEDLERLGGERYQRGVERQNLAAARAQVAADLERAQAAEADRGEAKAWQQVERLANQRLAAAAEIERHAAALTEAFRRHGELEAELRQAIPLHRRPAEYGSFHPTAAWPDVQQFELLLEIARAGLLFAPGVTRPSASDAERWQGTVAAAAWHNARFLELRPGAPAEVADAA